jgi:hypothetical protein
MAPKRKNSESGAPPALPGGRGKTARTDGGAGGAQEGGPAAPQHNLVVVAAPVASDVSAAAAAAVAAAGAAGPPMSGGTVAVQAVAGPPGPPQAHLMGYPMHPHHHLPPHGHGHPHVFAQPPGQGNDTPAWAVLLLLLPSPASLITSLRFLCVLVSSAGPGGPGAAAIPIMAAAPVGQPMQVTCGADPVARYHQSPQSTLLPVFFLHRSSPLFFCLFCPLCVLWQYVAVQQGAPGAVPMMVSVPVYPPGFNPPLNAHGQPVVALGAPPNWHPQVTPPLDIASPRLTFPGVGRTSVHSLPPPLRF